MGGGYFSLKKVLSIILILTILIIPFQTLLNVKAEGVVITTDETKTLEGNTDFQYVKNTTTLKVDSRTDAIESFSAYKILDVYYNKKTNEMTYGFTSDFKDFIDQLPETDEFSKLTVKRYQEELTSDNSNNSDSVTTTSSLNKLVSKYATYLKKKSNASPTSLVLITERETHYYYKKMEVGSYLVLPTEAVVEKIEDGSIHLFAYTYGVSVANIIFSVSNGEWTLDEYLYIQPKSIKSDYVNQLLHVNLERYLAGQESDVEPQNDIIYSANKDLFLSTFWMSLNYSIPSNTHSSILNNTAIMDKIKQIEYVFPEGIKLDKFINEIDAALEEAIIRDGKLYYVQGGEEKLFSDIVNDTANNKLIISNVSEEFCSYGSILLKMKVDNNIKLTTPTNAGNTITTNAYYLKDAYVDISSMSQEEAEEAVLGVGTLTNTVYTYGVKVTNKDNSTLLNGAKFQVYADEGCTEKVGEEFEITENGTYTFKGLNDTDTYYLKQTKASTGYKMASTITLSPTSLNKETGYYDVEVTSAKMGLLPTTGGLGTILYTTFGLLIIVVGSITFISYRKRQVNVNN